MKNPLHRIALRLAVVAALSGGLLPGISLAADDAGKPAKPAAKPAKKGPKYTQMDYGPFLTASFISDPRAKFDNNSGSFSGDSTARGIAIKLSDDWKDGLIFDMDLLRVSGGWNNGALVLKGLIGDGGHGWSPHPSVPLTFQTPHLPGWANKEGSFKDPRPSKIDPLPPAGPLPKEQARYNGLYRHGNDVVLSYTINGATVLETFGLETSGDTKAFARTIRVEKSDAPLAVMIADANPQYPFPEAKKIENVEKKPEGYKPKATVSGNSATLDELHVALVGAPEGANLEVVNDGQLVAKLPAGGQPATFKILVAGGGEKAKEAFAEIVKASPKPADLAAMTKGGPGLWKQEVETKGVVSTDTKEPYVVDQITLPFDNPYDAWIRVGGFDFFPDGKSAALSTWSGDVWVVRGIDDKLDKLTWRRYATGLHQPLGLKIVGDDVYTVGHDQITRLKDVDGDGEADFYENFNNDWQLTTAFHAFAFDLHTDKDGNFYFAFGAPVRGGGGGFQKITDDHGTILKVSKDGSKIEHFATGLRAPNGMGVGPNGEVAISDNQGSWVPTTPLHWVSPGEFLGVSDSAHGAKVEQPKPLCWLSHAQGVDNSGGGQVWVTSDRWGPFQGDLLHMSYGQSRLFKVLKEEVNGQVQGGVVAFPLKFSSGIMRARFNPADGQLYVAGLKGWQTNAARDGGFDRVRYTGAPVYMPKELHATERGVSITFTQPLDPETAGDPSNYSVEVWNYKWSSGYGSPEVSTAEGADNKGKKNAHDSLTVKSAKLQPDGKTVFLEIEGIKPVMQMKIDFNIDAKDKPDLKGAIYNTIHALAPAPLAAAGQK